MLYVTIYYEGNFFYAQHFSQYPHQLMGSLVCLTLGTINFHVKGLLLVYKGKGKAHPLQAMQAQRGLGELMLLDFLTSALYGDRLSASRTDCLYPQGHPWSSFS
jgi:hypothetical protein